MRIPKIIVHCLVKNEENFIWYAIKSVLPFVDKIMVWDTGSTDNTVEIIKSIKSFKIDFKEIGSVDSKSFTKARNDMLIATAKQKYDWLMILDGDEIWPSHAIRKILKHIDTNPETQAVFVRTINVIGDIYHKQPESAGHYKIKGITGHLGLRFINLKQVPGLHVSLPYGKEGYFSQDDVLIQKLPNVDFVETSYLHATHLKRSSKDIFTLKRGFKRKFEIGEKVDRNILPQVLFKKHSAIVKNVTRRMSPVSWLLCVVETLPRYIKRILHIFQNEGY